MDEFPGLSPFHYQTRTEQRGPSLKGPSRDIYLLLMSLARASPGWDSTCNQRLSFPWGKIQRWIFPGHSWVWWWDTEIHILQLLQGLSQVGEETKALKQQHRGKLHLGDYLYKNQKQSCSSLAGSWAQALSTLVLLHLKPVCCTHAPGCASAQVLTHVFSAAVEIPSLSTSGI